MVAGIRTACVGVAGAAMLLVASGATVVAGEEPLPPGITRMAGETRYDTSAAVAAQTFTAPVDTVFIATGRDYPDALAAGPLAGQLGGPVLLVQPGHIPVNVRAELNRLEPRSIQVLGGREAVSGAVLEDLRSYADSITRVDGQDRYATAALISQQRWESASTVFLATGTGFADALSGGSAAAALDAPMLLTQTDHLPAVTREELASLGPTTVYVLGGELAISQAVEDRVQDLVPGATVTRIAGADRYETSSYVIGRLFPDAAPAAFYANGSGFADALSGVPAAAVNDAPLVLTRKECLPMAVYPTHQALDPRAQGILGGPAVLTETGVTQECGINRYPGAGDEVLKIAKPSGIDGAALLTISQEDGGDLEVWALDDDGDRIEQLVQTTGRYTGDTILDPADGSPDVHSLEISADASWLVSVQTLGGAPRLVVEPAGAGTSVRWWGGEARTAIFDYSGSGAVEVWALTSDGAPVELLVDRSGSGVEEIEIPAGTRLVTVEAEGPWRFDLT